MPAAGVLDYTRQHQEDRITWQPQESVRIAAVVVRYTGKEAGFVLAGRSLHEIEARVDQLTLMVGLAMVAALAACLVVVAFCDLVLVERRTQA